MMINQDVSYPYVVSEAKKLGINHIGFLTKENLIKLINGEDVTIKTFQGAAPPMDYRQMVERAKEIGIQYVGVRADDLYRKLCEAIGTKEVVIESPVKRA